MLMIPLPFVIALFAVVFLIHELLVVETHKRNGWFIGFLILLIFQELLIGIRFGYSQEWLREIQPLSAAVLPPAAYLSFKRPELSKRLFIHLVPLAFVILALLALHDSLDAVLALSNMAYAVALIRLGLSGSDELGWVEFGRTQSVQLLLWLVSGILILSGVVDGAISYDFWQSDGTNTAQIAGWASASGLVLTGIGFLLYRFYRSRVADDAAVISSQTTEVFNKLNDMMEKEKLFMDPDINLNRIARRMILPAREVSRSVNAVTGNNVSQYVNSRRIQEACRLLHETDMSIIQIAFASGFNTKSNFNREFLRVEKKSPSEWRDLNKLKS